MTLPNSASLFDDGPGCDLSLVAVLAQNKPLTKAQKRFQKLVEQIELKREQLKQWQAYGLRYNQRLLSEMEPLQGQLRLHQRQMVLLIDELLTRPQHRLGRMHRHKLHQILMDLLGALSPGGDDEPLRALRDRYHDGCYQQAQRSEIALTRSMLRDVFDLDVGDDHGASSAEELLAQARHTIEERLEREAERPRGRHGKRSAPGPQARGPKAEAAEVRRAQAAKEVSQSLRDVFRKLVSALHPDREPDDAARQRKTLLMQRVNQAYEANDLLTLLGLQLEIEQIDAAHLSSVPPQRLAHYNQILGEQLAGLESELERCTQPFRQSLDRQWGRAPSVAEVDRSLTLHISQLRSVIQALRKDLVVFRDPQQLRYILQHTDLAPDFDDRDDWAELQDLLQASRRPRRR